MSEPTPVAPRIPAGYGVPTDASGAEKLPWSWAVERLTEARNYWICSTRADGRPHAAPVWGLWLDGALWFGTDESSQKGRNMTRDPRIVVHLESGDETVILEGAVESLPAGQRVLDAYEAKYGLRPPSEKLHVLRPRTAQTWLESDYTATAVRWLF